MTLGRVLELDKYWAEHPPIHDLKAMQLGLGKKELSDPSAFASEALGVGYRGKQMGPIPEAIKRMMKKDA